VSNRYDISITQGSTFLLDFKVRDKETGNGLFLASYSAVLTAKADYGLDALFVLSSEDGEITLDNDGNVSCVGSPEKTAVLPVARLVWDIELSSADGTDVFKPLAGKAKVGPEASA
jgi:hypothetical protein